jgi:hypothetical protein
VFRALSRLVKYCSPETGEKFLDYLAENPVIV